MKYENRTKSIRTNPVFWKAPREGGVAFTPPGVGEIVIYCNKTFGKDNWDIIGGTLYFKSESDAIMFKLKYGYKNTGWVFRHES